MIQLMQPVRPTSLEFSLPSTEPQHSSSARNVLEWVLLAFAGVGFVIVYVAVLYGSPLVFVAGLALCGIIAAISLWLQIFHRTPEEADAASSPDMQNRFDWSKLFKQRCRHILTVVRSMLK